MGRSSLRGLLVVVVTHVLAKSAESHVVGDQNCNDDHNNNELRPVSISIRPSDMVYNVNLLSTSMKVLW